MGVFKTSVRNIVKTRHGRKLAAKDISEWYNGAYADKKDLSVFALRITDKMQLGKMYRFVYTPLNKENLNWYDRNPLILFVGRFEFSDSKMDCGINLNLLPFEVRVFLMDKIFTLFKRKILPQISGRLANNAKKQRPLNIAFEDINRIVKKLFISYAVRFYAPKKRRQTAVISYEHWSKMMLLEIYKFKKTNPNKVYKGYYKFVKKRKKQLNK